MSHQVPPFISIGAEKDHEEHPNEAASTGGPRGFEASKGRPLQGVFWEGKLHGCWPAKDAMENVHFLFHINFQRHVRDWKFECLVKKNGCKCAVLMRCKYECSHHFGRMCLSVWVRVELCENSLYGSFFPGLSDMATESIRIVVGKQFLSLTYYHFCGSNHTCVGHAVEYCGLWTSWNQKCCWVRKSARRLFKIGNFSTKL